MARRKQVQAAEVQELVQGTDPLLEGMNPEQAAAIVHRDGPLMVLAGAGSGKTRVLIHRVAHLVRSGVDPQRILAVTFSKNAADEMKERGAKLGLEAEFRTWHSLSLHILREDDCPQAGWKVDDTNRATYLLKEVIGYKGMDWKPAPDIGVLTSFIGFCKSQLWSPSSPEARAFASRKGLDSVRACDAFARYDCELDQNRLLTFDDMLVFCAEYLRENAYAREKWAARWDYVLQDEAQDANPAQLAIAEMLARDHRNYMVVGDPAQSIYKFRGSEPRFLTAFVAQWQGATVVAMHRNYRCGAKIIDAANAVIRPSPNRLPTDIVAEGGWDGVVQWKSPASLEEEGQDVAGAVQEHQANGSKLGDCAVLYRLNAQSRGIEEALLAAKIPYVVVGGVSFYERKEVKDLLAYLRLVQGRAVKDSVKRALNAPFRYLGAAYLEKVIARMGSARTTADAVAAVLGACDDARVQYRQKHSAVEFCDLLTWCAGCIAEGARPSEVLKRILDETRYDEWLRRDSGEESLETSHVANVKELVRVAERFGTAAELLDFVDSTIDSAKQNAEKSEGQDRVLLMSIHKSKGLEFAHVHLVGAVEQVLPHPRNEDQDEERRLCYVAMTRAKQTLLVTSPMRIATKRGVIDVPPSRFVVEAGLLGDYGQLGEGAEAVVASVA